MKENSKEKPGVVRKKEEREEEGDARGVGVGGILRESPDPRREDCKVDLRVTPTRARELD